MSVCRRLMQFHKKCIWINLSVPPCEQVLCFSTSCPRNTTPGCWEEDRHLKEHEVSLDTMVTGITQGPPVSCNGDQWGGSWAGAAQAGWDWEHQDSEVSLMSLSALWNSIYISAQHCTLVHKLTRSVSTKPRTSLDSALQSCIGWIIRCPINWRHNTA